MITAIRMDDITPDMDFRKFNRVKAILDEAGLKPLIGVVPYNMDEALHMELEHEDFGNFLVDLERRGWVIALHGFNHRYTTREKGIFPINNFSEFAGVDYDRQNYMIAKGIDILKNWGVTPKVFMAPGHTFDMNTLKALKVNNLMAITDGFGKMPYIRKDITFYPISKKRSECTNNKFGYSTYVLHTNTMTDEDIDKFATMIKEKRKYFISYCDYLKVKAEKRNLRGNLKEYILAYAKHVLVSRKASEGTKIYSINGETK